MNKADARLATMAIDEIDDFVEAGAGLAGAQIKEARSLWSRLRKSETIEEAMENADVAARGDEAGLRDAYKGLWRARNKKKMRGFSTEELAAIKKVALGSPVSNTLRRIGSLSGGTGQQRNMLNGLDRLGRRSRCRCGGARPRRRGHWRARRADWRAYRPAHGNAHDPETGRPRPGHGGARNHARPNDDQRARPFPQARGSDDGKIEEKTDDPAQRSGRATWPPPRSNSSFQRDPA